MKTRNTLLLSLAATILLFAGIIFLWPQTADAQCGSSASSCKTCHETQGADPVNTVGDWHTQHAFGDFCEFCHAGNVQATDKDGAHEGLASPLGDVAASCQSCHPDDMMERAGIYASTLGIELGAEGPSGSGGDGDASGGAGAVSAPVTGVAAPLGGEEIDMNLLYAEKTAPKPLVKNWGNFILSLMSVLVAGAFLVTAWTWEGWSKSLAGWIKNNVTPVTDAIAEKNAAFAADAPDGVSSAELKALFARKPELAALLPKLMEGDPELLADLDHILSHQPDGARLLHAVSRVDLNLLSTLKQLDKTDRELLLAIIKEL